MLTAPAADWRVRDFVCQRHDLIRGEENHLLLRWPPESRTENRVLFDRARADGQRHHETEHISNVSHGARTESGYGKIR
jgi:hypothetical protein